MSIITAWLTCFELNGEAGNFTDVWTALEEMYGCIII